jgi:hypothetical protein
MRHIHLGQQEKSGKSKNKHETHMPQLAIEVSSCRAQTSNRHSSCFSSTSILDKAPGYIDCMLIQEATDIWRHPRKFNRDGGFNLRQSWYLVTNMINQYRDMPIPR